MNRDEEQEIDREKVLGLISSKNWDELMPILRDNKTFQALSEDPIFTNVFNTHFVDELINQDTSGDKENIAELGTILTFHKSESYNFRLSTRNHEKLIVLLVEKTQSYDFAKELPHHEICIPIIQEHDKKLADGIAATKVSHEIQSNFSVQEIEKKKTESYAISVFKSPQEQEFYEAARQVFSTSILLPNTALSTVINNGVLEQFNGRERGFFLSTTVDLVVIDSTDYKSTHFFELDSSYHDSPEQKARDELKNRLISEAGFELYRIRKKSGQADMENYITFLKEIKARSSS